MVRSGHSRKSTSDFPHRAVFQSLEKNSRVRYGYTSVRYLDEHKHKPFQFDDMPRCDGRLVALLQATYRVAAAGSLRRRTCLSAPQIVLR